MRHRERYKQGFSFRWDMVFVTIVSFLYITLPMDFAHAFDGQRKGFILGGGAGLGYATVDQRLRGRAETVGLQTVFIIGAGVSDQVTISFTGLQFWGSDFPEVGLSSEVELVFMPSVGVRYFLSPDAPSFFGALGFGFAFYDAPSGGFGIWGGGGFAPHLGLGYEFARHYSAELDLVYMFDSEEKHKPLVNIMFLVTALAY